MVSRAEPWGRVVLEVSLRPFAPFDDGAIRRAAAELAEQWRPLLRTAESAAVLLWTADGSEILEWRGDMDAQLEWASWVGFCNTDADPYGHNVTPDRHAVPYRDDVAALTYGRLAAVVAGVKTAIGDIAVRPVEVGATFDSGPEFARSRFKYHTHPEIVAAGEDAGVGRVIRMVRPWSRLRADPGAYAAFPAGIPDGLSFGTFLGAQAQSFLGALGFDYFWFSNGFGFSSYAWTALGEVFDGETFRAERAAPLARDIVAFWEDFRRACDAPLEVRGTNFTAGLDAAVDGVPADVLYGRGFFRKPPPNSPWGPLNDDFGIEVTGHLSRIARLPGDGFPYRLYAHDPWFWQNPWRDFYGREAFDVSVPLALSRLDADGSIGVATDVEILTVDDESGRLDARDAAEIQVALATARATAPDAAGPVVWLYPFREYHALADADAHRRAFDEEWLIASAVNAGLPLATVVSTDDVEGTLAAGALDGCIVVTPRTTELTDPGAIAALRAAGIDVCVYGTSDAPARCEIDSAGPGRVARIATRSAIEAIDVDHNGLRTPRMRRGKDAPGHAIVDAVASLGVEVRSTSDAGIPPLVVVSRHDGGLQLAGYLADESARVGLRLPQGAPVFSHHAIDLVDGVAWSAPGRSPRREIRVLVEQSSDARVAHRELDPFPFGRTRRFRLTGLQSATVHVLPPTGVVSVTYSHGGRSRTAQTRGGVAELPDVTGELVVSW